ncbi:MAG: hypothetical protein BWY91_03294 [bacterium ADurb.BinA028]|nr:MAG: hypothetical protein BWY91_03294 [bacterium ADurb.BinA028]
MGLVEPVGRHDVQPERPQRRQVRLNGAGAEVAAPGIRQSELGAVVQQRPEEHDDRAGASSGVLVDPLQVQRGGRHDLQVVGVRQPTHLDPHRGQHLDDAVDLLDPGQVAQRRAAAVEQRRAQQGDRGVLGGLDVDGARQLGPTDDPQMLRARIPEGHQLAVQGFSNAGEHLQRQVLVALLDPRHRALTRPQQAAQLGLSEPLVPSGIPDERANPAAIVLRHAAIVSRR